MEPSFSGMWLLWGQRNGQKPVLSLKTAFSHSIPINNISNEGAVLYEKNTYICAFRILVSV